MRIPDPFDRHPIPAARRVGFLKPVIENPNIIVGDYTYYDDPAGPENFEDNVLYHFPFVGDKLIIGKFCALAHGVKFVMNGANHRMTGFSTYPFDIFGHDWVRVRPSTEELPYKGDTILGNDVWLGYDALVMPGVCIGDGAVVATRSVVTSDVPPYAIVGGNPARVIRLRFPEDTVAALLEIRWWDWEIEKVTRNLEKIVGADLAALRNCE